MLEKSLQNISAAIHSHEISVRELVTEQLDIIKKNDDKYGCFITVAEQEAYSRAEIVQEEIDSGKYRDSVLAGIPIAIKDNICTKGIRTTCGSKILSNFIPPYNAEAVNRIERAGAIVIGKTNLDEFAMGSTTETSYFGVTRNPVNALHVPGGSSGGSAAAVAGGEAIMALGSDTGGSIRQPCSYCGITGIKPTYGSVSRYGLIAYASSFDQIGAIARNTADAAHLLEAIVGKDTKDATSVGKISERTYISALGKDTKGLKIGMPKGYMGAGLDLEVKSAILKAADAYSNMGAEVEEFELEAIEYAVPAYYVIAMAQASSNLSRYDGIRYGISAENCKDLNELYIKTRTEGFGTEAKRRILLGTFVLSSGYYEAYYSKALKVRSMIKQSFDRAFEKYDIILGPTTPTTAPLLHESLDDPLKMYMSDAYTVAANLCGLPAINVCCGKDSKGMPIGMQLIAKAFNEYDLIKAADKYEKRYSHTSVMSK